MFQGTDDLRQTKVTQPAIFLHSVILAEVLGDSLCPAWLQDTHLASFLL